MSELSELIRFDDIPDFNRRSVNGDLKSAGNTLMLSLIGNPRGNYDQECRDPTNPAILRHIVRDVDVGPFEVDGLRPAVDVLRTILADVRAQEPAIYDVLSHAGMLCCRFVRDSHTAISNHSWGTAIDLKLEGRLDTRGDNRVQRGLLRLHPIFNRHQFFWGAAFGTEDSMHFEASEQLVRSWAEAGVFGAQVAAAPPGLTHGDRGPAVTALQEALNRANTPMEVDVDGIFGSQTRAAVIELQRRLGIMPDGTVNQRILDVLGL